MRQRLFALSVALVLGFGLHGVALGQQAAKSTAKDKAPKIIVNYDIKGADENGKVFVQNVGGRGVIGKEHPDRTKWNAVKNGGKLELNDLDAGKYQVTRLRHLDVCKAGPGRMKIGVFLDRHQFDLKVNEVKTINFVRRKGQRAQGRVLGLKAAKLDRAAVFVCSKNLKKPEARSDLDVSVLDARLCDQEGRFETEQLPVGDYVVLVEAYVEPTQQELFRSGGRRPKFVAMKKITISADRKLEPLELSLKPNP